jgi:primosomal protein N' (replication factor Y)
MPDSASQPASGGALATIVDVLVPVAVDTAYSYRCPPALTLSPGDVVAVPLGTRETVGVVWASRAVAGGGDNLKDVLGRLDAPALPSDLRRFLDRVAAYTLAPRGMVARLALRGAFDEGGGERVRIGVRLTGREPQRLTPARVRVIAAAAGGLIHAKRALAEAAGVSNAVIDGLVDEGVLEVLAMPAAPQPVPDAGYHPPRLNAAQRDAAQALAARVAAAGYMTTLLDGITGSGKTEVYFEAIAEALRCGRQSLVLLPEIALTAQFLDRFAARFGARPAEWHSGISGRRRHRAYGAIADGSASVVVGARSALFLPFARLGLIVVDEEHEAAYRQEDGVHYHARDMAVLRASIEGISCILSSATPSVESRVNAERGRYHWQRLASRFGAAQLPAIEAIDLRQQGPARGRWIAPRLVEAVQQARGRGEQALLFLNRRGYAPLTLCDACGHRFQCPNCSAWLVEHRFSNALHCHHCGHRQRRPDHCPACGGTDRLIACGPGVERLAEEVADLFADARTLVLSSDFPGGTERLRRELTDIAEGKVDIVIGTQIVAKGHNFPNMTVVGVVDADLGLSSADPRAAERTFQIVQQVVGRAGRFDKPGRAYLQTRDPDHPVLQALVSGDSERFYAEEIALRQAADLPPFGRLAALVISAKDRLEAEGHARALLRSAPHETGATIYGPAEAPLAVVRGQHRIRLLVKTSRSIDLQGFVRTMIALGPKPRGSLRVTIDIDPMSFL